MLPTPSKEKPKELKVTDKRIFTAEGEIREEFRDEVKPADPQAAKPATAEAPKPVEKPQPKAEPKQQQQQQQQQTREERRRSVADRAPATPFTDFLEQLIAQAYMFLGMLRDPRMPKQSVDVAGARQMIDIITMLKDKTAGNLTPDEEDFLSTHLGELKLAFVQRTKTI